MPSESAATRRRSSPPCTTAAWRRSRTPLKHGGRGVHISVALAEEDGRLTFRVVDDGPGFAMGEARGLGLQSMEDRLGALGGRLTIATAPGRGTTISGHVPLRPAIPEP